MSWVVAITLLVLWGLGFFAFNITTPLIHLLIVIAFIVVVARLVTPRKVWPLWRQI